MSWIAFWDNENSVNLESELICRLLTIYKGYFFFFFCGTKYTETIETNSRSSRVKNEINVGRKTQ